MAPDVETHTSICGSFFLEVRQSKSQDMAANISRCCSCYLRIQKTVALDLDVNKEIHHKSSLSTEIRIDEIYTLSRFCINILEEGASFLASMSIF